MHTLFLHLEDIFIPLEPYGIPSHPSKTAIPHPLLLDVSDFFLFPILG